LKIPRNRVKSVRMEGNVQYRQLILGLGNALSPFSSKDGAGIVFYGFLNPPKKSIARFLSMWVYTRMNNYLMHVLRILKTSTLHTTIQIKQ